MSIYRNVVWYFKGLREYTKSGFELASKNFKPSDLEVDCSSKSFLVTGGNSGIGYEFALEIAKRQGSIHLVCRNEKLGNEAKESIVTTSGNSKVYLHIVDLAQPQKVIEFTRAFGNTNPKLNVLVNNAGCMVNERRTTEDTQNLDINFATNTLASYLMTIGLTDCLTKSEDPRVIFVSSGGMLVQRLNFDDFNFTHMTKYDGVMAYAQNKRQQVVMCEELAKSTPGINFYSMHPGWCDTPAVRASMPDFYEKMKDKLRTAGQGADTVIWLAISNAAKDYPNGSFFQDRVPVDKHLPLAWTHSKENENQKFMEKLKEIMNRYTENPNEIEKDKD